MGLQVPHGRLQVPHRRLQLELPRKVSSTAGGYGMTYVFVSPDLHGADEAAQWVAAHGGKLQVRGRGRLLRDATNAELGQVVGALDRLGLIEKIITAVVAE
jgi:hypothetical protein